MSPRPRPRSGPVSDAALSPGRLARAGLLVLALAGCESQAGKLEDLGPAPDNPPARAENVTYVEVGQRLMARDRPEVALKAFNLSMIEEGVSHDALVGAAAASYRLGRVMYARRLLIRAVEAYPDSATARNNLGVVYYTLRDYPHARASFNAAFALESGLNEEIARNLAMLDIAEERVVQDDVEVVDPDYYVEPQGGGVFRLVQAEDSPE